MSSLGIIFKNAFFITFAMVAYFFFLRGFGLDNEPRLRLVNILFILTGINNAIRNNILINLEENYVSNLLIGLKTSLVSFVFTLTTLAIYINFIQPSFIKVLQKGFFFWENNFNLPMVILVLFMQGILVSLILSALLMLYWKNYHNSVD